MDQSYIGKGSVALALLSGGSVAGPRRSVGNCSELTLSFEEDKKTLLNNEEPGGGLANSLSRITSVGVSITLHDFSPDNFAMAVRGSSVAIPTAPVVDEPLVGYKNGIVDFRYIPDPAVPVVITNDTGATTYVDPTDYTRRRVGIEVPAVGSAITDAQPLFADYTRLAQFDLQAMVAAGEEFELLFDGLNEAQSDAPTLVKLFRFKPSPTQSLPLIGDDYAAITLTGELLMDSSIVDAGLSKFFRASVL